MVGDQGNTSAVLTDLLVREGMTKMMYEFGRIWRQVCWFFTQTTCRGVSVLVRICGTEETRVHNQKKKCDFKECYGR